MLPLRRAVSTRLVNANLSMRRAFADRRNVSMPAESSQTTQRAPTDRLQQAIIMQQLQRDRARGRQGGPVASNEPLPWTDNASSRQTEPPNDRNLYIFTAVCIAIAIPSCYYYYYWRVDYEEKKRARIRKELIERFGPS